MIRLGSNKKLDLAHFCERQMEILVFVFSYVFVVVFVFSLFTMTSMTFSMASTYSPKVHCFGYQNASRLGWGRGGPFALCINNPRNECFCPCKSILGHCGLFCAITVSKIVLFLLHNCKFGQIMALAAHSGSFKSANCFRHAGCSTIETIERLPTLW